VVLRSILAYLYKNALIKVCTTVFLGSKMSYFFVNTSPILIGYATCLNFIINLNL